MSERELSDAEYDGDLISEPLTETQVQPEVIDSQEVLPEAEEPQAETGETVASTRNSYSELRKLQREMFRVAHSDPFGSARASAARVWRDLELLRLAKLGKPVCLTGKAPEMRKQPSAPIVALASHDQSQAA